MIGAWRRALGDTQERNARAFLEQAGLDFVASNIRCRLGEVDLVMRDGHTLVFVEVRYRSSDRFGGAAASVDRRKQARLTAAAAYFLKRLPVTPACRFDVIAIGPAGQINWIRHAFAAAN
jgi:putative endonuclease